MTALGWFAGVLLAFLPACRSPGPTVPPAILRTAGVDDVPTLDPALGYDTTSWFFEQLLFNTLVDYGDGVELVPELATSWTVGPDGRTYSFALNPAARFSNGDPVVAADVRYSIERVLNPDTRSPGAEFYLNLEGARDFAERRAAHVRGIETPDEFTVTFHLERFDPLFLHKLALQFAAVVPRRVAEGAGPEFAAHPVGSGPFALQEWRRGEVLRLRRNPHYFAADQVRIEGVDHVMGVTEQLEWMKFEAGELDVASIPAAEFPRVSQDPRYRGRIVTQTAMTTNYLGMNCQLPPFDDLRVRRAVSYAIDRDKALRLINRRGVPAQGILPPGMPGYEAIEDAAAFDPEKARRLLAEAGYPGGFDTVLWTRTDEEALRLAQSYQQDLAAVGIRARIKNLSWASFLEAVRTPRLVPLFLLGWQADFPDPSNFLEVLFHSKNIGSNNHAFFADAEVDRMLDAAAAEPDAGKRLDLLRAAHRRVVALRPWALLYHPVAYAALHPRVRNYRLHALRPPRLEGVELESATAEGRGLRAALTSSRWLRVFPLLPQAENQLGDAAGDLEFRGEPRIPLALLLEHRAEAGILGCDFGLVGSAVRNARRGGAIALAAARPVQPLQEFLLPPVVCS